MYNVCVQYFVSQQGASGDMWKKVMKACYPIEYAATREGDAKQTKAKELMLVSKEELLKVGMCACGLFQVRSYLCDCVGMCACGLF